MLYIDDDVMKLSDTSKIINTKSTVYSAGEVAPFFTYTLMQIARAYIRKRKFSDAYTLLNSFIEHDPKNCEAYTLLAETLIGLGDVDRAKESYEFAIELDPERAEPHLGMARLRSMLHEQTVSDIVDP
jgi:Flp pilus assembly protein TadD